MAVGLDVGRGGYSRPTPFAPVMATELRPGSSGLVTPFAAGLVSVAREVSPDPGDYLVGRGPRGLRRFWRIPSEFLREPMVGQHRM